VVIKIGGRSLEAPGAPQELATEVASLSGASLLVHGGGRDVSAWCERAGIAPQFVDGLRVTDPATLEVAVAVLAGLSNKRLVARLRAAGLDAVGLSAADGGIAEIEPHPDAKALGQVGIVTAVDAALIETLLAQGRLPVLASIGARGEALYNLNADELAGSLAGALRASTLLLLSDTPGVVIGGRVVPEIAFDSIDATIGHPEVQGGMLPKLAAARKALALGAARVRIAAWNGPGSLATLLGPSAHGTTLTAKGAASAPRPAHEAGTRGTGANRD
jgi:acetylglutamate kinase